MAGDGLVRPLNAPPAVTPQVGVQPGSTGVDFARVVIVFGPAGTVSGIFVYAPGTTPGPGNPPQYSFGNSAADPYGNATQPGIVAYGSGGSYIDVQVDAGFPVLFLNPAGVTRVTSVPNIFSSADNAGLAGELMLLSISSGKESGMPDSALQLWSAPADGSAAAFADFDFGGQIGIFFTASGAVACQPGTLSTKETWHSLGSAGATGCTLLEARYRLTPDGECEIDIALEAGSGGSTAGTYTWSNTLPAAYQFPGSFLRVYPLPFNAPIVTATQDSVIVVDGASSAGVPGRVRITIPAVAANVFFTGTCRIPLT